MKTKSRIQEIREELDNNNLYKNEIKKLTDTFLVKDNIFAFNGREMYECVDGYFVAEKEYDTITDLFENVTYHDAIRIKENSTFVVGKHYNKLNDCPKDADIVYINV